MAFPPSNSIQDLAQCMWGSLISLGRSQGHGQIWKIRGNNPFRGNRGSLRGPPLGSTLTPQLLQLPMNWGLDKNTMLFKILSLWVGVSVSFPLRWHFFEDRPMTSTSFHAPLPWSGGWVRLCHTPGHASYSCRRPKTSHSGRSYSSPPTSLHR